MVKRLSCYVKEKSRGYPDNVEGAVIAFFERFQKHNKSATRKLALLIRSGVTPVNKDCVNTSRLPVRIASDFTAPLVPPTSVSSRVGSKALDITLILRSNIT